MLGWILKYRKLLGTAIIVGLAVMFIMNHIHLKRDRDRIAQNNQQLINEMESALTELRASKREMSDFIDYVAPDLRQKLDSANIKLRRIQQVVVQKTKYVDTVERTTNLDTILHAIEKGIKVEPLQGHPIVAPIVDKTPCLLIRGNVSYDGKSLELNITERKFTSINEVVSHIQRRQWKFLGLIPTRLFGKREIKVTVFNDCGETKTTILTKEKGKWQEK
jgi:hypothetical protein